MSSATEVVTAWSPDEFKLEVRVECEFVHVKCEFAKEIKENFLPQNLYFRIKVLRPPVIFLPFYLQLHYFCCT